jgi:hypothetical protein
MKGLTMFRRISLVLALLLVSSAAFAQPMFRPQSSPEDRACRGDERRFCRSAIPDQFRVLSCLQANRHRLSRACRAVLAGHGQ